MKSTIDPIISLNYGNLDVPGVQVEVDPDEVESLSAFEEIALSEADAWEANTDIEGE